MLDHNFEDSILTPFQSMFGKRQRNSEAERYDQLYNTQINSTSAEKVFPRTFVDAWETEFGISIDSTRSIIDTLEDIGVSKNKAVYSIKKSELIKRLLESNSELIEEKVKIFLQKVILSVRPRWDQTPLQLGDNLSPQDWYPWIFRRRLSLISKPFVETDYSEDPILLVSPGTIREGIWYTISNSYDATLDERHFSSTKMQKWIGDRRNQLGIAFNETVANKLIELGWEAESDILVTKLLNQKTVIDYGDIDVLAWSKEHKAVIAIECKDLFFAKTYKEIGNQINEFTGKIGKNGKRNRLRKHFDRLDVLDANLEAVGKYVAICELSQIYGMVVFSQRNVAEHAPQIPRERILVCSTEILSEPKNLIQELIPWHPDK